MARRRRSLGDLTAEQRQMIAEAPAVEPQFADQPCIPEPPTQICPPDIATPPWGNARIGEPGSNCLTTGQQITRDASSIPWWVLLLIAGGTVLAVKEALE